jgi:hypothetical protein
MVRPEQMPYGVSHIWIFDLGNPGILWQSMRWAFYQKKVSGCHEEIAAVATSGGFGVGNYCLALLLASLLW